MRDIYLIFFYVMLKLIERPYFHIKDMLVLIIFVFKNFLKTPEVKTA